MQLTAAKSALAQLTRATLSHCIHICAMLENAEEQCTQLQAWLVALKAEPGILQASAATSTGSALHTQASPKPASRAPSKPSTAEAKLKPVKVASTGSLPGIVDGLASQHLPDLAARLTAHAAAAHDASHAAATDAAAAAAATLQAQEAAQAAHDAQAAALKQELAAAQLALKAAKADAQVYKAAAATAESETKVAQVDFAKLSAELTRVKSELASRQAAQPGLSMNLAEVQTALLKAKDEVTKSCLAAALRLNVVSPVVRVTLACSKSAATAAHGRSAGGLSLVPAQQQAGDSTAVCTAPVCAACSDVLENIAPQVSKQLRESVLPVFTRVYTAAATPQARSELAVVAQRVAGGPSSGGVGPAPVWAPDDSATKAWLQELMSALSARVLAALQAAVPDMVQAQASG